jgi:outer membrane receptor for ferrienterochelin and colicin
MKGRIIVICLFSIVCNVHGQTVRGVVYGKQGNAIELLPGATLVLLGSKGIAVTDEAGQFEVAYHPMMTLVTSFLGFKPDTTLISEPNFVTIILQSQQMALNDAIVKAEKPMAHISSAEPIKTEIITQKELTKAACCDLAGCFETQATVQPQTTNVVTNSKELRILGLSGVYNQLLFDGMPFFQGLSYTYGISSYPGTLVDNIYVAKGANSVLQGFESISGQINVEPKIPDETDKLLFNAYTNSFLEKHLNLNYATALGKSKKWSTLLALHTILPANKTDTDDDLFLDLPLINRYMVYNRWKYGNDQEQGVYSHIGLRFLYEHRIGGQTSFNPDTDEGSNTVYGQSVSYSQPEFYTKTGYRFNDHHAVTMMASTFFHTQNSYFGTIHYKADQRNIYINLQHEILWRQSHLLKYGASFRSQELNETIMFTAADDRSYDGLYKNNQVIPGVFAENAFHWQNDKIVWIVGARMDHHQKFGSFFTPRSLLKYSVNENNTIRGSLGRGWREVNLFSENINILSSSRDIVFEEEILPEQAMNWGLNYTYRIASDNVEGTLSADFYQTLFSNQFFPDYDSDPLKIYVRNFTGKSVSNAFQIEAKVNLNGIFEIKTAYNYLEVYRIEDGIKNELPFNPKNRLMAAMSYRPAGNKWYIDVNAHWFDKQRLPNTDSNPPEYRSPGYSDPYTLVNAQLTLNVDRFEFYTGVENIFNFRQLQPIISWQDPFGDYFDTSFVWGPTRGREFYLGLRWRLGN